MRAPAGFEKSAGAKYLVVLQRPQIVRREVPATERNPEKSKLGFYRLHDRFFELTNRGMELGDTKRVLTKISRGCDQYLGEPFEDVCRGYCPLMRRGEVTFEVSK